MPRHRGILCALASHVTGKFCRSNTCNHHKIRIKNGDRTSQAAERIFDLHRFTLNCSLQIEHSFILIEANEQKLQTFNKVPITTATRLLTRMYR
jgi:hypothetical protein